VVRAAQQYAACDIIGLEAFNEDDLYGTLDWLDDQQAEVEKLLFSKRYGDQKPTLYLYDVTSSYLEGQHNEYGAFGYDRDRKKGKKQIVIGLLTDQEGWPIACQVFKGNTQDPKTVLDQVRKLALRFEVKKVTFIGDRGMLKSAQIQDLKEQDFQYVTALTKPQIQSLLQKNILQMGLFDESVQEVRDGAVRYILRRNPLRAEELLRNREDKWIKWRAVAQACNHYLETHPRARLEVALRKTREKAQRLKIDGWARVKAVGGRLVVELDAETRKKEGALDGCYVIKTDVPAGEIDKEKVHQRYKDLAEVEWAFRTMKTVLLELRGIFVRRAKRTRAHVFVVMLAYMLAYQLRRAWATKEITVEEGVAELSHVCSIEVQRFNNAACQTIPEPRPLGQELLDALNIRLPEAIPCRGIKVVTRKKLVSERRDNVTCEK
jgi:transposase